MEAIDKIIKHLDDCSVFLKDGDCTPEQQVIIATILSSCADMVGIVKNHYIDLAKILVERANEGSTL